MKEILNRETDTKKESSLEKKKSLEIMKIKETFLINPEIMVGAYSKQKHYTSGRLDDYTSEKKFDNSFCSISKVHVNYSNPRNRTLIS